MLRVEIVGPLYNSKCIQSFANTYPYCTSTGVITSLDEFNNLERLQRGKTLPPFAENRVSVDSYLLKCSLMRSSLIFSGKFPTHKCLVSLTIVP